ncbi:D-glycero-beta-D-manno-heptose-7-phosphate kinase [Candidatus Fermentibacteria bacterium]|nr:D-glycero-beta-D-manno-heptose-7-phosphate kinase [Candidatus Fermentibacteria bacterium]
MTRLRRRRLLACIQRMQGARVLVTGDYMLDKYVWGTVHRVSPEAPVPILVVDREEFRPGGAGNVAANVSAMGGTAMSLGLRGDDPEGATLREVLLARGIKADGLIVGEGRDTTVKCRIVAHSQQLVRMDRESTSAASTRDQERLLETARARMGEADALIMEDYNKGVLTPRVIETLIQWSHERGIPVAVDPKLENFHSYRHVTLLKPNQSEVERFLGIAIRDENQLVAAGTTLRRRMHADLLLITRGERGMTLFGPGRAIRHIPSKAREVYDVSGAGDTAVAVMALALACGAHPWEAAYMANAAAGICVSKIGTQPVSVAELEHDVQQDETLG